MLPLNIEMFPKQKLLQRSVEIHVGTFSIENALENASSDHEMCLRQK